MQRVSFLSTGVFPHLGRMRVPPLLMSEQRVENREELVHTGGQSHPAESSARKTAIRIPSPSPEGSLSCLDSGTPLGY